MQSPRARLPAPFGITRGERRPNPSPKQTAAFLHASFWKSWLSPLIHKMGIDYHTVTLGGIFFPTLDLLRLLRNKILLSLKQKFII